MVLSKGEDRREGCGKRGGRRGEGLRGGFGLDGRAVNKSQVPTATNRAAFSHCLL